MIITLVIDTFNTNNNGTTISAMNFSEALSKRGHNIRIVTCGDTTKSGPDPKTGYEMFYLPEHNIPMATYYAHKQHTLFAKPVRETLVKAISGADVVHIYEPWALGIKARKIAGKLGIPSIAAFHVQPENITYNIGFGWFKPMAHIIYLLLYLTFYRRFKHIHCPSKFIAAQLRSHGYKAILHVISNGVHQDFVPALRQVRKAGEPFKILMVGRFSPEKRQDVLMNAVRKSRHADRIQLYFAGFGPWENKLLNMGRRLKNKPVFGYYSRGELIKLMHECDLYVHASDVEIEGISCMEAFSCGMVPIISDSGISATAQFALSPDNLFRAGRPSSLAAKIDYWIENPKLLLTVGDSYARYSQDYKIDRIIGRMESVYRSLCEKLRNEYQEGRIFKLFSRLFYFVIAIPVLFIWTRLIMDVRIKGGKNIRGLKGALTVCNHVHFLDSALVGLALFPRKIVFPTLPQNLNTIWPGKLVHLLGGVEVPGNVKELKLFFDEMELLLLKGRIIHFFPEGELVPYDTRLREFKKGAFYLAAQARVPIVPMSIKFQCPKGLYRLIRKKPVMRVFVGKPIYPVVMDFQRDSVIRMRDAREQMERQGESRRDGSCESRRDGSRGIQL
ncbi:MAG: glycosyltransferase [Saccharofermentanales bacterium]